MFHIALFEPEIPHNTGNIIRLCANTGCLLHLIGPLGFNLDNKQLKRAGLDYHDLTRTTIHSKWEDFESSMADNTIVIFSTKGTVNYDEVQYSPNTALVFGPETRGLPEHIINSFKKIGLATKIPMMPNSRSINLSNSVAIAVYEAWRQNKFIARGSSSHLLHL
ncbi:MULTISPECIES: tRNA (cytidine(34)-2'-O)-methyltransferase [Candidatus Ichthyocystis]|uniref:tRNA (cytidine(34)-2'-O)-methyltransferase n=1 Tax=Candidatus Ichthyocystis TaxID=2929841 RepID=UPI000ABBD04C|nr:MULTISPECIES: tRNA (cytidine(34)-2'-O)-methyltransferase [Ichthyocystis]